MGGCLPGLVPVGPFKRPARARRRPGRQVSMACTSVRTPTDNPWTHRSRATQSRYYHLRRRPRGRASQGSTRQPISPWSLVCIPTLSDDAASKLVCGACGQDTEKCCVLLLLAARVECRMPPNAVKIPSQATGNRGGAQPGRERREHQAPTPRHPRPTAHPPPPKPPTRTTPTHPPPAAAHTL